jgi:hypothetical protein
MKFELGFTKTNGERIKPEVSVLLFNEYACSGFSFMKTNVVEANLSSSSWIVLARHKYLLLIIEEVSWSLSITEDAVKLHKNKMVEDQTRS